MPASCIVKCPVSKGKIVGVSAKIQNRRYAYLRRIPDIYPDVSPIIGPATYVDVQGQG
ncbi:MAG TPA: hypothetical protein VKA28_01585 [Candidatus Bathyarchaeia archaeon]|nr:hypothetical protein [Candidatus Bathyarchaeia archaeon]